MVKSRKVRWVGGGFFGGRVSNPYALVCEVHNYYDTAGAERVVFRWPQCTKMHRFRRQILKLLWGHCPRPSLWVGATLFSSVPTQLPLWRSWLCLIRQHCQTDWVDKRQADYRFDYTCVGRCLAYVCHSCHGACHIHRHTQDFDDEFYDRFVLVVSLTTFCDVHLLLQTWPFVRPVICGVAAARQPLTIIRFVERHITAAQLLDAITGFV